MNFEGVIFVVSGASSGVGKILCDILISYNATVIGIYNKHRISNQNIDSYKCDLKSEKEIQKLFNYVEKKYKKIDVIINCAALSLDCDITEKSSEDFVNVLKVNLVAPFLMCKYGNSLMDKGVIVNISSTDAQNTYNPISLDYCASKAGLENLTKNLALRFPKIKICALAPAWINTDTVLEMDKKYLETEMKKFNQKELLRKEDVALKIIEIIINVDNYITGDIIRMERNYE